MRKNSIKNTRINGEVQKVLSNLISREIKDPRINSMTSVVSVEVSPDLKTAKVYISVLGDDASKESTRQGLKSAASFMRGQLAKTLNLRNTPELTFIIDNSIEYGVRMSKLIAEVNKDINRSDDGSSLSDTEQLSDEEMKDDEVDNDDDDNEDEVDKDDEDNMDEEADNDGKE